jgi:hypothetical protein
MSSPSSSTTTSAGAEPACSENQPPNHPSLQQTPSTKQQTPSKQTPSKRAVSFTRAGEEDSNTTVALVSATIEGVPYLVWIFQSPTTSSMFASFFDLCVGRVKTKRLTRGWAHPPCVPSEREHWLRANIGSVLLQSRGPENTPAKPPRREPPLGGAGAAGLDTTLESALEDSRVERELVQARADLLALQRQAEADKQSAFRAGADVGRAEAQAGLQVRITELEQALALAEAKAVEAKAAAAAAAAMQQQQPQPPPSRASSDQMQAEMQAAAQGHAKGRAEARQEAETSLKTLREVAAAGAKRAREEGASEARAEMQTHMEAAKRAREEGAAEGRAQAAAEAERTLALIRADLDEAICKAEYAHAEMRAMAERHEEAMRGCEALAEELAVARQRSGGDAAELQRALQEKSAVVEELTAYVAELLANQSR